MSLDKILSIAGKPGLFKLVTRTRSGFVAESLTDGKKISVGMAGNVSVLSEIAIYTLEEELPLREVFAKIREKEEGAKTAISHKAGKLELEEYFFGILPNYDEDRVYPSDIRKVIQWYNLLHDNGIDDFSEPDEATAGSEAAASGAAPSEAGAKKAEAGTDTETGKASKGPKTVGTGKGAKSGGSGKGARAAEAGDPEK